MFPSLGLQADSWLGQPVDRSNGRTTTVIRPGGATEITTSYLDGRTKSVSGTAATPRYYTYGVNADGTRWTRVDMGAQPSPRYEITTTDMAGNVIRTEKPGFSVPEVTASTYDALGRLMASSAPGLADSLYEYDELGNLIRSGLDVNGNGHLDDASSDRIQESSTAYAYEDGAWWQKTVSKIYAVNNSATPVTTGVQKTRLTGLGSNGLIQESVSLDINGNQTISRTTVNPSTKTVIQTVDYPDTTNNEITITVNGLTASHQSRTGVVTTFSYDGLGRRTGVIDPRTGTSVTHYDSLGRVDYVQDPASHQTAYTYDPATGRRTAETSPAGKTTRYAYNNLGQVTHKWGTAVEPVAFDYDSFGQMTHMNLYRSGTGWDSAAWPAATAGDPDTTTWGFQESTGLLLSKTDDAGKATTYAYAAGGKLHTRTWARQNGALVTAYGYDPATGELTSVDYTDATPDVTYTYTRAGQMDTVTDAAGTRSFAYNSDLQLNTETMTGLYNKTITRTYETSGAVGRATGFSLPGYSATYGYDPATGRFKDLTWNTGAGSKTTTYAYTGNSDLLDTVTTGSLVTDFAYESLRNVKTRVKHTFGGAGIIQYDYTYDPSGRRDHMDMTPDLPNAVVPTATTYTPNNLNQYQSLNKNSTTDTPAYDEDGNLISSSLIPAQAGIQSVRAFTWDAENRLTSVAPQTPAEGDKKVAFVYDYMGRRVKKMVSTYSSGSWLLTSESLFLYDGWNLIQELDGTGAVQKAYVWGLDLSQSLQGAGGVGGLLAMTDGGNTYLYCHDANGNVGRMVNAADGVVAAAYEYAPFGSLIHKSGSAGMEDTNPFRFSTKYWDSETGLYYYGFRYYEPGVGRWMSRDPAGEQGGNIYLFCSNNPVITHDILGLVTFEQLNEIAIQMGLDPLTEPTGPATDLIKAVQIKLGFKSQDGDFGPATVASYESWVKQQGLQPVNLRDPKTPKQVFDWIVQYWPSKYKCFKNCPTYYGLVLGVIFYESRDPSTKAVGSQDPIYFNAIGGPYASRNLTTGKLIGTTAVGLAQFTNETASREIAYNGEASIKTALNNLFSKASGFDCGSEYDKNIDVLESAFNTLVWSAMSDYQPAIERISREIDTLINDESHQGEPLSVTDSELRKVLRIP